MYLGRDVDEVLRDLYNSYDLLLPLAVKHGEFARLESYMEDVREAILDAPLVSFAKTEAVLRGVLRHMAEFEERLLSGRAEVYLDGEVLRRSRQLTS